jgi:serine protease AprX
MPSSTLPPEEQPEVKPFDPLVLDRTVIAVPLLTQMRDDLKLIEKMHPEVLEKFNSVIEFNKKFRGGLKAVREQVLKIA